MWASRIIGALFALSFSTVALAQSWTAPRTWVTGELVTSSLLNTHVRDNLIVLRAGGVAIASQGANEIIYASSSTQLARSANFTFNGTTFNVGTFSTHTFSAGGVGSNKVQIRNTTAGTGNEANLVLGTDSLADFFQLRAFSSTFTPSTFRFADGAAILAEGAGGFSLATSHAAGDIRLYTGTTPTQRMIVDQDGNIGIGAASNAVIKVDIGGSFTAATGSIGAFFAIDGTITGDPDDSIAGARFTNNFIEAGSGNHARITTLSVEAGSVTGAAATVGDTATLYVADALSATVTGNNYAVWVDAGDARFDGHIVGTTIFKYKTADETVTSSTALQDDDHLQVALTAGTYQFEFFLWVEAPATPGIKLAVNYTGTTTNIRAIGTYLTATAVETTNTATAVDTAFLIDSGNGFVTIHGTITVSTSGTLVLRWAQNVSDAAGSKVDQNSNMRVWKVS